MFTVSVKDIWFVFVDTLDSSCLMPVVPADRQSWFSKITMEGMSLLQDNLEIKCITVFCLSLITYNTDWGGMIMYLSLWSLSLSISVSIAGTQKVVGGFLCNYWIW